MELRGPPRGPELDDRDAGRLLNAVLDSGINLIDTSIDYGNSEELIGRFLGSRRDEYFLASKCGCLLAPPPGATAPYPHDYRAANVRAGVEQSLRRLQTDHLDLVQVHMSRRARSLSPTPPSRRWWRCAMRARSASSACPASTPPRRPLAMGCSTSSRSRTHLLQRGHEQLISQAADGGAGVFVRGGAARGTASEDKGWSVRPLSGGDVPAEQTWEAARLDELLDEGEDRRVPAAVHARAPGPVDDDRRHQQPRPPALQRRDRIARAAAADVRPRRSAASRPWPDRARIHGTRASIQRPSIQRELHMTTGGPPRPRSRRRRWATRSPPSARAWIASARGFRAPARGDAAQVGAGQVSAVTHALGPAVRPAAVHAFVPGESTALLLLAGPRRSPRSGCVRAKRPQSHRAGRGSPAQILLSRETFQRARRKATFCGSQG